MADVTRTWEMIRSARKEMADTLEALTPEQWAAESLCAGWTVGFVAMHILAGAEQTAGHFTKGMLVTGFRFDALMERDARDRAPLSPSQVAGRLRQRTTTTNHPPAPVVAMLGEIVVHGEDVRRPLGLPSRVTTDAANACLDMYVKASFPVGGRKRIGGLRLVSTDTGWSWGTGSEVTGPALSLLLAMTGRPAGMDELSGDGARVLAERLRSA